MSNQLDFRAIRSVAAQGQEAERRAMLAEQRELAVHALNEKLRKTIRDMGGDFMGFIRVVWPRLDRPMAELAAQLWRQGTGSKDLPGPMPEPSPEQSTPQPAQEPAT